MKKVIYEQVSLAVMTVNGMTPSGPMELKVLTVDDPQTGERVEIPLAPEQAQEVASLLTMTPEEAKERAEREQARASIALPGGPGLGL